MTEETAQSLIGNHLAKPMPVVVMKKEHIAVGKEEGEERRGDEMWGSYSTEKGKKVL